MSEREQHSDLECLGMPLLISAAVGAFFATGANDACIDAHFSDTARYTLDSLGFLGGIVGSYPITTVLYNIFVTHEI